jgi:8-oxo-dGTP pyrophosphatase MutT (NUDIX family)
MVPAESTTREEPAAAAGRDLVPLWIAGAPRGRLIGSVHDALVKWPALVRAAGDGVYLRDDGLDADRRSECLQALALALREAGLVPGWRDEDCTLFDELESEIARFERGAFRTLGLQNRAVHVNGMRPDGRLWIARRSASKLSSPNKLDNMAAGAIAAGETPAGCAVRELWEEAGVPAELAVLTRIADTPLRSQRPLRHGFHDELIFPADLALPADFTPVCQDGEVSEFICMAPGEVRAALQVGEFSVEAGLVASDWLQRNRL